MRATLAVPALLLGLSTGGCTVSALDEYCPPPDLGRPAWVRNTAGFAGWIGGGIGAVVSVVLLPITYPASRIWDEPMGYSKSEFRWMPITLCASSLHYTFGAPADMFDWMLRRAWIEEEQTPGYDFTPMPAPKLPDPALQPQKQPEKPAEKHPEKQKEQPKEQPEERDRPVRTKKAAGNKKGA